MVKNEYPYKDHYPVWLQNLLSAYNVYFIQRRTKGEEYTMEMFLNQYAPNVTMTSDGDAAWSIVDPEDYDMVVDKWGKKMITLKDYMEAIGHRITGGAEFMWACYGTTAHLLDSGGDGFDTHIVFDTADQTVYEIEVWDYHRDRMYRWIHPDYIKAVKKEYKKRGLKFKVAIDDQKFIDLDVEEDILEKVQAIAAGEEYDERVMISLDMTEAEFANIAKAAHIKDITINQFMVEVLEDIIEEYKK